jgi:hypothetical protein
MYNPCDGAQLATRHRSREVDEQSGCERCGGRWSQGRGPRGTRASKARTGPWVGTACEAARLRKKEKLTALLHHINVDLLREALITMLNAVDELRRPNGPQREGGCLSQ